MAIPTNEIKNILTKKNITTLYHANTVATSMTFFDVGGLLSRGAVEERQLFQTKQYTDAKDRQFGIWNDIFFDSDDNHRRGHKINYYGPVLFIFGVDLLGDHEVKITKNNPDKWKDDIVESEKYFTEIDTLSFSYKKGNMGQHLTICDFHDVLPFDPYLKAVILDNPHLDDNSLFERARTEISHMLEEYPATDFRIRECEENCGCHRFYREISNDDLERFFRI